MPNVANELAQAAANAALNLNLAAAATVNQADQVNSDFVGLLVAINITTITGTGPSFTVNVQGKDSVSGTYYTLLASAALNAAGFTLLTIFPAAPVTANSSANARLPRTYRVQGVGAGGPLTALVATVNLTGLL